MECGIISLFPEMFSALTQGITGRAQDAGHLQLSLINPRDFTHDIHRSVDDRPYGGGPGMLMRPQPILDSVQAAKQKLGQDSPVLYLSPQGQPLTQARLQRLAKQPRYILLCGRYEGIDQRALDLSVDEEISLGDYVLSGGELAAMVLIDAVTRLLPGVLGNQDSSEQDSFSNGLLDHPHYTRPESFSGNCVPNVLLSGNHHEIARWREKQALGRTWLKRPDLLAKINLSGEQQALLNEFKTDYKKKGGMDNG